jgi:hypothetical protein
MALNPRMVIADTDVTWDRSTSHVLRGTIIDCPPGSSMETAYGGASNLQDLTGAAAAGISAGSGTVTGGGTG